MATSHLGEVVHHLRRAALRHDATGLTDGQLLDDYVRRRDDAALAALVHRHGPMVWGVCRRVLRDYHDAEDAFQATFLVLVRRAAAVVPREMVANWLYGVAHQTARKARATAAKRRSREKQVPDLPEPSVTDPQRGSDVRPLLDQELSRLPDIYRVAVVLCDLEGKTRKEAARQLGVPEGTLAARLARGRAMLAKRLGRHGVDEDFASPAGVPLAVLTSTIELTSQAATGGVSAAVAALAEGVVQAMCVAELKLAAVLLMAAVLGLGGVAATRPVPQAAPGPRVETGQPAGEPQPGAKRWKERATLADHADEVLCVAASADFLAVGCKDGGIKLWNLGQAKKKATQLSGHDGGVAWIAFSPDCRYLYSAGVKDGKTHIRDTKTDLTQEHPRQEAAFTDGRDRHVMASEATTWLQFGRGSEAALVEVDYAAAFKGEPAALARELARLKGHTGVVRSATFSLDGRRMLTGADDKTARVWDRDGKELAVFADHAGPVVFVALDSDGKRAATVGDDGSARLWDVAMKKEIAALPAKTGVRCAAFCPNGKFLATGAGDGTVTVRDAATGREVAALKGHKDAVRSLTFSLDGRVLFSGGQDKTVRLWEVEP